jgi:septum site-determining protein MinD
VARIVSVHSFRGGTGKSNTTASLAVLFANMGLRVGVVDTDIQSPGLHVLFGLDASNVEHSLNDYLWGRCEIGAAAHPVLEGRTQGSILLIPSSIKADEIVQVLRQGYDMRLLTQAFRDLGDRLHLDVLLIDTHPGLNEETLFSLAISTAVVIVLRPDQQDYEGTGVTVEVARSLEVPRLMLLVNKAPADFDQSTIQKTVEDAFGASVAAVLVHSDDMMKLGSSEVFALAYPDHPNTLALAGLARSLMEP